MRLRGEETKLKPVRFRYCCSAFFLRKAVLAILFSSIWRFDFYALILSGLWISFFFFFLSTLDGDHFSCSPSSCLLECATWPLFYLLACLVFTPPHWCVSACLSPCNPSLSPASSAPISPQLARRSSIHPPNPNPHPRGLSLSHFTRLGALAIPHTSCSVLVASILFRSVPCMLLLARWFSHPAVTPPPPQGHPRCAQLSLKTLPCRHGSLGSPCWRSALRVMTLVLSPNIGSWCSERVQVCQLLETRWKLPRVP